MKKDKEFLPFFKKYEKFFIGISVVIVIFVFGMSSAVSEVWTSFLHSAKNTVDILVDKNNTEWLIKNHSDKDYFVPNNTQNEFDSFKNFADDSSDVDVCKHHNSVVCYNNDVYWVDGCGEREEKKQECDQGGGCYNSTDCIGNKLVTTRTCTTYSCSNSHCTQNTDSHVISETICSNCCIVSAGGSAQCFNPYTGFCSKTCSGSNNCASVNLHCAVISGGYYRETGTIKSIGGDCDPLYSYECGCP